MNKVVKEYLNSIGLSSVDELTDVQVEEYYTKYLRMPSAAYNAIKKVEEGVFSIDDVHASMRIAMSTGVSFICGYAENESYNGKYEPKKTGWILEP